VQRGKTTAWTDRAAWLLKGSYYTLGE